MQRRYRLTNSRSFDYLYRKGTCVRDGLLVLYYAPAVRGMRVGFSVSKKVGKSVVRNKTKRRLKEAFRKHIPEIKHGFNYLVVARPQAADCDFQAIENNLLRLLEKAGATEAK